MLVHWSKWEADDLHFCCKTWIFMCSCQYLKTREECCEQMPSEKQTKKVESYLEVPNHRLTEDFPPIGLCLRSDNRLDSHIHPCSKGFGKIEIV